MKKFIFIVLAAFFSINFAASQDAQLIKDCRTLLDVSGSSATYKATISTMLDAFRSNGTQIPDTLYAKLEKELSSDETFEFLINECAKIYAKHFTSKEIKAMIKFYTSPVGKKMVTENPAMIKEITPVAMEWSQKMSAKIIAEIMAEMGAGE